VRLARLCPVLAWWWDLICTFGAWGSVAFAELAVGLEEVGWWGYCDEMEMEMEMEEQEKW
jgi:hypothetical protein